MKDKIYKIKYKNEILAKNEIYNYKYKQQKIEFETKTKEYKYKI